MRNQGARPLVLEDRGMVDAALGMSSAAPSEHCFANLFLFRERHAYRYCADPLPHIRGLTYDGLTHVLPLASIGSEAADALFSSGADCLFPLGDDAPALGARLGLTVSHVEADSDYLFDGPSMAKLSSTKLRRAQARDFAKAAEPSWHWWTPELGADAEAVLEGWLADVGRPRDATDVAECAEAIRLAVPLGLEGGLVRTANREPVGFVLASRREDGGRVLHFAKGRRASDGVYPWMFAHYAELSAATLLNFEQDLGNPGLAQSKRAYAPIRLRPKYRLSRPSDGAV